MERFQVLDDKKFINVEKSSRLDLTFTIWGLSASGVLDPSPVFGAVQGLRCNRFNSGEPHLPLVSSYSTYKRATQSRNVGLGDALYDAIDDQSGDQSGTGGSHCRVCAYGFRGGRGVGVAGFLMVRLKNLLPGLLLLFLETI